MGVLRRLTPRVKLLSDFYTLDVETGTYKDNGAIQFGFPGRPETFIFGVIYGLNHTRVFTNLNEMIEALKEPRYKNKFVFGHNIPYDLNTMFGNIFDMDSNAVFNGSTFITATNGNCKFGDSMNILGKIPLKKIGEMIGIEKPALGDDNLYAKDGLTTKIISRCIEDCHITWDALFQVFSKGGNIKLTGPALALYNFRSQFMKMDIEYDDKVVEFFNAYYGGRTEAFKIGPTESHCIDVNSMYPFIYRNIRFVNPKGMYDIDNLHPKLFLERILFNYEGMAYCTVKHKEHFFGFLPHKNKEGKLTFPVGTFSGCWCFPELRYAVEQGVIEIVKVKRTVYGGSHPSPFIEYVDKYYNAKRTETNKFEIDRVKHLLNDLYGKFAQRESEDTIYISDIHKQAKQIAEELEKNPNAQLKLFSINRNDAFLVTGKKGNQKIPHQIPSIPAYITSHARVHLLKEMIRMQANRVTYCDTDSIFFEVNDNFEDSTELGGWKLENKIITEIRGLKNYSYHLTKGDYAGQTIHRIKGVPKKAVQTSTNVWEYENLLNTKEALRRSLKAGVQTKRKKVITGKYEKRQVLEDGNTKPLML